MFTWICPKCGSEVPPSENDCPNCRARANAAAAAATEPVIAEPLQQASFPQTSSQQPVIAPPTPRPAQAATPRRASSLSPTLVALCSAVAIVALLAILYVFILPRGSSLASNSVGLEKPGATKAEAQAVHPLAKYIEITGLRVSEGTPGRARIAFVAVNHSPADLPELQAHLTLMGGDKEMFDFPVKIPSMGPYESKDIGSTIKTNLKPYELPDWQSLRPTLRIISEP